MCQEHPDVCHAALDCLSVQLAALDLNALKEEPVVCINVFT